jgi:hypothetical protein
MANKHNTLYLFLALACLVGIILIFIFDGYMGVYDSLLMDNGQYQQTIEPDQWKQQAQFGSFSVSTDQSGRIDFTYTVQNHRFSAYNENVDVSLWYNKVKKADLLSEQLPIPAFDKKVLTWSINVADTISVNSTSGQSYIFNLKIQRGALERDINLNIFSSTSPNSIKIIPAPVTQ